MPLTNKSLHGEVYFAKRYETNKGPNDCSEKIYMCAYKVVLIVNEKHCADCKCERG